MRVLSTFFSALFLTVSAQAAISNLTCAVTSAVPIVRAEGVAERVGDIVFECSGGSPGGSVTGNLSFFLNTPVTNKTDALNGADVVLTVDTGSGPVTSPIKGRLEANNRLTFNGLDFLLPATGNAVLRISNIRAFAAQLEPSGLQTIFASISFNGASILSLQGNPVSVARPLNSLLATVLATSVGSQQGSPLPETITFGSLLSARTRFSSARVTEAHAQAFQKRGAMEDHGLRIISRYSSFPVGARLFVPDVIAGSNSVTPTAGGDFGTPASGGQYAPGGGGSLLLVRVRNTDANGAGGNLVFFPGAPGSGSVVFDNVGEVDLVNGAGFAVYEVVDSNPSAQETAQFPTFIGLAPVVEGRLIITNQNLRLGPISTVNAASPSAPVPRFLGGAPGSDCTVLGDCSGNFLPKLQTDPEPLQFSGVSGAGFQVRYVRIFNSGGGLLVWNAVISYKSGSNWLRIDPSSGVGNSTLRVDSLPANLAPGFYEATLTIDAGAAGVRTHPISVQVRAAEPPPPPAATISGIVNAATFAAGSFVRGSFVTLRGTGFGGTGLVITFDGLPASVLFSSSDQVNLRIPEGLGSKTSAQVVVTVNNVPSQPFMVTLAEAAPGIFNPGILNQDNSVNSPSNPAQVGSVVQIFATGLFPPTGGVVEARLHDRTLTPQYAGAAPGIPGLQQVNLAVPGDLPAMTTEVVLCSVVNAQRVCSLPVRISLRE